MGNEIVIGLDPHKRTNTIAALDLAETVIDQQRFINSDSGIAEMVAAMSRFADRVWAVEGSNGVGNAVALRLVKLGETVFDVPAKLAARVRVYLVGHGTKTDDADAVAIARAAIHSRHLRQVRPDGPAVAMRLLSDRRHELVAARTQAVTRLHRLLRELIVGGAKTNLSAEHASGLLNDLDVDDPATEMRVDIARDHIADIERLDLKIDEYSLRIIQAVKASKTTLTRLFGVGPLNAALIFGDVGDVSRFPDRNHFASCTGTAPIAVSSGDHHRHRLSRSGNRRLNRAIHIAAITQIRFDTPGRVYYRRKLAEGKARVKHCAVLNDESVMLSSSSCALTRNRTKPKTRIGHAGRPNAVCSHTTNRRPPSEPMANPSASNPTRPNITSGLGMWLHQSISPEAKS